MASAIDSSFITPDPVDKAPLKLAFDTAANEITALQSGKVDKSGDAMTGDLTVSKANPSVILEKAASGQSSVAFGSLGATRRWSIELGNAVAETGTNAGSNFAINRYNDAGVYLDTPLTIVRATGAPSFANVAVWRVALNAAAIPTTSGGVVGTEQALQSGSGSALVAPAGGTWMCKWQGIDNTTGGVVSFWEVAEVPGGTVLKVGSPGINYIGFAYRKA